MTIELVNPSGGECLGGAFECIVYDRFGDMSVTHWGKELSCEEAMAVRTNSQQEEGAQEPET